MTRSLESLRAFVAGTIRDTSHRVRRSVVVFGAGKGGVGTSAAAGLVALAAARRGSSVLLVDGEETVGSLHLMFGLPAELPGLGSLRGGKVAPTELLVEAAPGLTLFPGGGGGVDATLAIAAAERRMLLRRVSELYDAYDLVVVDGGSRLDSVMAACAAGAGRVVGVTTPDRISQAAVYALLKVVRGRFGDFPVELMVAGASDAAARDVHATVQAASSSFLGEHVGFGGALPEDAELRRVVSVGGSLTDLAADAPTVVATETVADRILSEISGTSLSAATVLPLRPGTSLAR